MKINAEQYNELVEKLANELVSDVMEKTAAGSLGDYIKGDRDFSDPENQKTKFWKDRVGGVIPASLAAYPFSAAAGRAGIPHYMDSLGKMDANAMGSLGGATKEYGKYLGRGVGSAMKDPRYLAPAAVAAGVAGAVNNVRGKNLAKSNDVEWTAGDTVKSVFLPYIATPDAIVKKKVRKKSSADAVKEAAVALVEAVMYKQAAYMEAEEAELVAEASEMALNHLGYSMNE